MSDDSVLNYVGALTVVAKYHYLNVGKVVCGLAKLSCSVA